MLRLGAIAAGINKRKNQKKNGGARPRTASEEELEI